MFAHTLTGMMERVRNFVAVAPVESVNISQVALGQVNCFSGHKTKMLLFGSSK